MPDRASEMLVSADSHETRVAILESGQLTELYVERAARSVVGNIYAGKVTDVLPGMSAAFVDIGLEKNAYLHIDEVRDHTGKGSRQRNISSRLTEGQKVVVQVTKDPMGTKGARLTMNLSVVGRYFVLMPYSTGLGISKKLEDADSERLRSMVEPMVPEGMGVVLRTAAVDAHQENLQADIEFLKRVWRRIERQATDASPPETIYTEVDLALRMVRDVFSRDFSKLVVDNKQVLDKLTGFVKRNSPGLERRISMHKEKSRSLFEAYEINDAIAEALDREVQLPSGGRIVIEQTEALVAIDVNTGSFTGRRNLEDTILKTNLEAAREALRQLRLRDLGGIIVIDFIDMGNQDNRAKLMEVLQEELAKDRTTTKLASAITSLGLVQITRKNESEGLYATVTEPCPCCQGHGRVFSRDTRRIEVERAIRRELGTSRGDAFLLAVSPDTYELLTEPGANVVAAIRSETGKRIHLSVDKTLGPLDVVTLVEGTAPAGKVPRRNVLRPPV